MEKNTNAIEVAGDECLTPFESINPLRIANELTKRKLPKNRNLCLYALIKRTKCSCEPHTFKDELIRLANSIAKSSREKKTPDGAEWDSIFRDLESYHLVVTAERAIRLDSRAIDKIHNYYGKIVF